MQLSTPADLLALIPTLMNREPEEILVLIVLKDGHLLAAMGMELLEDEGGMAEYVSAIVQQMAEIKPDSMVPVFYTETESGCDHQPFEHVDMLLRLALDLLTPMSVQPGLLVKGGRFTVYGSDHWHDLAEVKTSNLAANMVLNGIPLEPTGLVIPEPTAVTDEVSAAIVAAMDAIPDYPSRIEATWRMPYVTEQRALYGELLERGFGATEEEAVRLIACFQNPLLRDRLMVDTISNTMDPEEMGEMLTGQSTVFPDQNRLDAAVSLMDNLMQWTNDRHRLPLLLVQAWLHWMQGRALDAEWYLDRASAIDPDYRMAKAFHKYIHDIKRLPDCVAHGGDE